MVIDRLSNNSLLDKQTILQLPVAYRTTIARNLLGLLEGRLICYEPTPTVTNHICCITVPIFLRRKIFTLRCATPLTGHMGGGYKALYGIKLRFFWSRLCSDVADWIKKCSNCMLAYHWRQ